MYIVNSLRLKNKHLVHNSEYTRIRILFLSTKFVKFSLNIFSLSLLYFPSITRKNTLELETEKKVQKSFTNSYKYNKLTWIYFILQERKIFCSSWYIIISLNKMKSNYEAIIASFQL